MGDLRARRGREGGPAPLARPARRGRAALGAGPRRRRRALPARILVGSEIIVVIPAGRGVPRRAELAGAEAEEAKRGGFLGRRAEEGRVVARRRCGAPGRAVGPEGSDTRWCWMGCVAGIFVRGWDGKRSVCLFVRGSSTVSHRSILLHPSHLKCGKLQPTSPHG